MYRNICYRVGPETNWEGKIHLFTWDKDGNPIEEVYDHTSKMYVESPNGEYTSMFDTKLRKLEFKSVIDRYRWIKEHPLEKLYDCFTGEKEFLYETYEGQQEDVEFTKYPLRIHVIDIEFAADDDSFAVAAEKVNKPINAITIYDNVLEEYNTWVLRDTRWCPLDLEFKNRDNIKFHVFNKEVDMYKHFIVWYQSNYPDVITGWNCLNKKEHIWLKDKIINLSNLSKDDELSTGEHIVKYADTGIKDEYMIKTVFGNEISSSSDHIFPIYKKNKNKYKYLSSLTKKHEDQKVHEIIDLMEENDIFVEINKRKNTNKDLTYRDLIINNISTVLTDDFDIIISDIDFRNKIKNLGLCSNLKHERYYQGKDFWKRCPSFWSIKNISNIYNKFDFKRYLQSVNTITIQRKNGHPFTINLDQVIDKELFKLLGFVFTDGTISNGEKFTEYCFSSVYKELSDYYVSIYNKVTNSSLCESRARKQDNNFYKKININNEVGLLSCIIYKGRKKKLNINILSQLSYSQFVSFYSGLIDGDGSIDKQGIQLCHFCNKQNLYDLQELLLWNNVTSSVWGRGNIIRIPSTNFNEHFIKSLDIKQYSRAEKLKNINVFEKKNTPSKYIKYYETSDKVYVKIDSIEKTGKRVEMADIETPSHYFTCKGIKTHNCEGFDIPYLIDRMEMFIGDAINFMSPLGIIKKGTRNQRAEKSFEMKSYKIRGISVIDYLILYKYIFVTKLPSHKLDFVADHELGYGKMEYQGSIKDFYKQDFARFVEYNIIDVKLVKELDEKLRYIDLSRTICNMGLCEYENIVNSSPYILGALRLQASAEDYKIITKNPDIMGLKNSFTGGYVFEPKVGSYRHGQIVIDFNSLYPNVMIMNNISPETKFGKILDETEDTYTVRVDKTNKVSTVDKKKFLKQIDGKLCKSANNMLYINPKRKQGIIPKFLARLYNNRVSVQERKGEVSDKIDEIDDKLKKLEEIYKNL